MRRVHRLVAGPIPSGAEVKQPVAAREILRLGLAERSYILYVGRLSEEKGAHHLLSAYRRLATDCRLVLAGPPCGRRYYGRLRDLAGADQRILFTGPVRGRLLEELFSNARLYVQPSQLEGLSLALLEAMSYGNGCLVSDIPENLEAIGPAGWHFRSGSPDSLAERLGGLLDHREEALAAGQLARTRVQQHYNWDRVTDRLEALYRDLLSWRRAA
ncbi:MAG: hypothetical protein AMJ81_05420 [Phycisphaerae bacterium SM23_33]|nr:MAG: hypothetical protein AMJ81_05420 [Phycisphaerae bacterium SM23_33]